MSNRSENNALTGKLAEDAVLQALLAQGFTLLERNYRAGRVGELDIIVQKGRRIYIVEVKSRKNQDSFGGSASAITAKKRMKLKRSTAIFLAERHLFGYDIVFLAGCVTHSDEGIITNVQIIPF
jgi:putative endonuclease